MTEVVTEALRERWLRLQRSEGQRSQEERARLIERALAIAQDCGRRLAHVELPEQLDDLLFDERGLPHDAGR